MIQISHEFRSFIKKNLITKNVFQTLQTCVSSCDDLMVVVQGL